MKTRKHEKYIGFLRAFVVAFKNIKNFSAASAVSALNVIGSLSFALRE